MTLRIREASVADAEAIARVHVQAWRETYCGIVPSSVLDQLSVEQRTVLWNRWLAALDEPPLVRVVENGGQGVVGFVIAGRARAAPPWG